MSDDKMNDWLDWLKVVLISSTIGGTFGFIAGCAAGFLAWLSFILGE